MAPNRQSKNDTPEERRIAKALRELKDGTHKYVSTAATANSVPYGKLWGRFNGRGFARGGHNKILDKAQEDSLIEFIKRCTELGRAPKKKHIRQAANSILRASKYFNKYNFYIRNC